LFVPATLWQDRPVRNRQVVAQLMDRFRRGGRVRIKQARSEMSFHARDQDGLAPAEWALRDEAAWLLQWFLKRGALLDPSHRLAAAILCDDLGRVEELARGEDLNRVDRFKKTPLVYAVRARNVAIVDLLLRRGADPDVRTLWGSALYAAAQAADPRVIERLIRGGANVHAETPDGDTPLLHTLWWASERLGHERLESVRILVAAGSRLWAPDLTPSRTRCTLIGVVGQFRGFSDGHAAALQLILEAGGRALIEARGGPALLVAADRGHGRAVEVLLTAGASLDVQDKDGRGPVVIAVQRGHADVLAALLRGGAPVPSTDQRGRSLWQQARTATDPRVATLLEPYGLPADHAISTAGLADAIAANDLAGVARVLDAGIDVNAELPEGDTAATLAARLGYADLLRALAARGAAIDRPSRGRWSQPTPLFEATTRGHTDCVQALIELGCNVDLGEDDTTPLSAAVSGGRRSRDERLDEIVRMLLAAGADPYLPGWRAPLDLASNIEIIDLLLAAMHDPTKRRAALKAAVRSAVYGEHLAKVRHLLEQAPDLHDEPDDACGERPIDAAACRGNAEILTFLLSLDPGALGGRDGRSRDMTPLMLAVLKGKVDAVRVMVEAGADVRSRHPRTGYTPVMFACYVRDRPGYPQIVDVLLTHGAERDARAHDGRTAVMIAAEHGLYGVVEVLLRHGADLSVRDDQARDVFDLAQASGLPQLVELLAEARRQGRSNESS
jgi:ankyrin repeat protein